MKISTATPLVVGLLYAAAASAHPDVPLPPQTQTAQVAKRIIFDGLEMHAKLFRSSLPQQRIVDFYRQQWGKQASVSTLQVSKIVGHADGDYFITVQVAPDGTGSKGTIGMVRLPADGAPRPQLGKGLPQPAGARVVNDISYPDDRTPARTVLLTDHLSPNQNADYFRSRLIANGWKDANVNQCAMGASHCVMQFRRGDSRMMFVSEQVQGRSQVLINILDPAEG